jgi:ribosome-binding factor A
MSRRTERIGKLLQQTIGEILLSALSDPRIDTARTSITRVKVQEDLLRAKVYVSVMGTDPEQRRTLEALNHAARRIHGILRQEVQLRHMPTLEFLPDEQFKGALQTWEIIRQAMEEIHAKEAAQAQGPEAEDRQPDEANQPTKRPNEP